MTTTRLVLSALAVIAAVTAGCGGSGRQSGDATASKRPPTVPADLLGRYTTTLRRSDLPDNPAPELTDGSPRWNLTIARSGGIGNGPTLTIANARLGVLESSNFVAAQRTILLRQEECGAPGGEHFYSNRYRYTLSGGRLRFSTIANGCADKVAETILTSRPWRRTG